MIGRVEVSDRAIADAVAATEDEILELLCRLVEAPTTLGNEEPGQVIMAAAYHDLLGLEPVDIAMDAEALRAHPQAAPFSWDVSGKHNYGAMVALKLKDALDAVVGGIADRPEAGVLPQKTLFAPGQSIRWDRLVEKASGSRLSVESLAREVSAV
jgi:hypothetical protein